MNDILDEIQGIYRKAYLRGTAYGYKKSMMIEQKIVMNIITKQCHKVLKNVLFYVEANSIEVKIDINRPFF